MDDTLVTALSNLNPVSFLALGGGTVVWTIFLLLLAIFIIYSLLLLYHWVRYGVAAPLIWAGAIVYFFGSFILLNTLFLSALTL